MGKQSKNAAVDKGQGINEISTEDLLNLLGDGLDDAPKGAVNMDKKKEKTEQVNSTITEIEEMDVDDILKELKNNNSDSSDEDEEEEVTKNKPSLKKDEVGIKIGVPELDNEDESEQSVSDDFLGEYEEDISLFFTDKLSEELGLDIDDANKPKSVKDVIDMMRTLIDENSKPEYGDERVAKLDEYVKNGGKFEDFYTTVYSNKINLEEVDIDNEEHQKQILKEHLINTGMKESQIDKKIRRWEDAGVLADEAEEALDAVKEYREETEKRLLAEQRKAAADLKASQQKFINDVDETIKNMKDVLGVPITDKQKKDTLEYIFKPVANGASQYQIDFSKDPKHLVLSAYLQKFGSNMVKSLEKGAETKAAKTLREKLASSKGKRGITQAVESTDRHDIFSAWSSQFLPK